MVKLCNSGSYGETLQVKATICRYKYSTVRYGTESKMTHLISNVLYGTAGIRTSIPYIQRIINNYGTVQ